MVRDAINRRTVAHFRAHTSPLAALQFSPGGDLLATASVRGHNIHVFRISGSKGGATPAPVQHLYCLHRGVTAAAIRGLAFAPDSRWVAVSSGRGTTHLFRTPAAAVEAAVWELPTGSAGPRSKARGGVSGQPARVLAIARARKPGLLSSGAAGAAAWAALSLAGHPAEAAPAAAAFVLANVSGGLAAGRAPQDDPMRLVVVTADGMLTQHRLHQPAAVEAQVAVATNTATAEPQAEDAALPVLEESERWDVCRHRGWPEREEALPGFAAPDSEGDEAAADAAAPGGAAATILAYEEAGAGTQESWVAQAESVPTGAKGVLPLWQDAQFRFVAAAAAEGAGGGLLSALGGEGANNSPPAWAGRA